jgi:succinate-semialdehyde dehydrogenase/glutarate-semialdehyde dehydrogenase
LDFGSIYTKDIERLKVADQIDSGMVFINQPTASQPDLPFEELSVLVTVELAEQGIMSL